MSIEHQSVYVNVIILSDFKHICIPYPRCYIEAKKSPRTVGKKSEQGGKGPAFSYLTVPSGINKKSRLMRRSRVHSAPGFHFVPLSVCHANPRVRLRPVRFEMSCSLSPEYRNRGGRNRGESWELCSKLTDESTKATRRRAMECGGPRKRQEHKFWNVAAMHGTTSTQSPAHDITVTETEI